MNIYFVYALIDPRDGSIFYIGKGKNNRPYRHLEEAKKTNEINKGQNPYKIRKIKNILAAGYETYDVIYLHKNLTEKEAFELEIKEIASHDNLTNISLGGEGGDNITNNPNYDLICKHISEGGKKRFEDPEERKKCSKPGKLNGMYGKHHTKESIEKMMKNHKHGTYEEQYGEEKANEIKLKFSINLKEQYANGRKPTGCYKRYNETTEEITKIKEFMKGGTSTWPIICDELNLTKKQIIGICKRNDIVINLKTRKECTLEEYLGDKKYKEFCLKRSLATRGSNNPRYKDGTHIVNK